MVDGKRRGQAVVKGSVRTVFIFLVAGMLFYLLGKFSYLWGFLFFNSFIELLYFVGIIIGAIWAAVRLDTLIFKSRYNFQIQTAAILLMAFFFTYQMFASHFYSEQYLKERGLEKIEQLYKLGEQDLDANELRNRAEEITVRELAFSMSLYGTKPWLPGVEELEILEFERSYHMYEMVMGTGSTGETARYTFTRDGLDFKISGYPGVE